MITDQAPMEEEELVGFRFHPTSYELVNHHLKRKLQKIDEKRCAIPDVNIYNYDPRDLCTVYNEKSYKRSTTSNCYFFCPRNRVNGNSARNSRQARGGFWRETSTKQDVEDEKTGKTIGTKRIFVFRSGKQGNDEQKTEYVMHEYHLNADPADCTIIDPMSFSVCHVKKKGRSRKGNTKKRQIEKGNPKKQQSKKVNSLSDDAGSSSPDNFQESSPNMEEEQVPTQPQEDLPNIRVLPSEQLVISGRSAFVNDGFNSEQVNPYGMSYEQGNPVMESGLEKLGSHGSSADFGFHRQVAAELRTPDQIELPNIEYPDSTARAVFENEGNAAAAANDAGIGVYDDGLSLKDSGFLNQEWIRELVYNT